MRSTMHMLAAEDVAWLVPLFVDAMNANSRKRLLDLGVEPSNVDRGLSEIRRALGSHGATNRDDLTEHLARKGIDLDVRTRMHMFRLAVTSGIAFPGPDDERGRTCLVLTEDWLGEPPVYDREAALRELARRYLRAFGPATEKDFAGWAGLGLRDIRAGLAGIGDELVEVKIGNDRGWRLRRRARSFRGQVVRLLPGWDTYLMGYRDRGFMADGRAWKRVMPGGGILYPSVVVDGALVGTWRAKRTGWSMTVRVEAFGKLDSAITEAIEAEVADIGRFEGRSASLA
jgi:hypothetical protein